MSGPRDAEITIVGGGAIGAAVAYFLARDGRRDVQLLEGAGCARRPAARPPASSARPGRRSSAPG